MSLQQIVSALHVGIPDLDALTVTVDGVTTDSRSIRPRELFVALRGEKFDGHSYVASAFERGAAAAMVESARMPDLAPHLGPLIGVDDTLTAYGALAASWRSQFDIPVIGITGSVGKTTTKEMLAASLSCFGPILCTERNENNEVGVPHLLLRLDAGHRAVVVEMGMRGAGQIAALAKIASPTVGVVSRIAENHIELLGSVDAIADAKGELLEALSPGGLAVINADDPYAARLSRRAACRAVTFSASGSADGSVTLSAHGARPDESGKGWSATARYRGENMGTFFVPSAARHDLGNALSAILTALELGAPFDAAVAGLQGYRNVGMRMDVLELTDGATILSDCYNASPTSTRSALETLAHFPAGGRKIAFLGDMKELGAEGPRLHAEVAEYAGSLGIVEMYSVGETFAGAIAEARERFADSESAAQWASSRLSLSAGDVVLVKGSRAMAMERIVEALSDQL